MRKPCHNANLALLASMVYLSAPMLLEPRVVTGQTCTCPGIHVTVLNIRNNIGTVDCGLFDAPNGFPVDVLHFAMRVVTLQIRNADGKPPLAPHCGWR